MLNFLTDILTKSIKKLFRKEDYKRNHIEYLFMVALADGHLDMSEYQFLVLMSEKYGVSIPSVEELTKKLTYLRENAFVDAEIQTNQYKRFEQVCEFVEMMLADGKIHPEEITTCQSFAEKLGFAKQKAAILIEKLSHTIQVGAPRENVFMELCQ